MTAVSTDQSATTTAPTVRAPSPGAPSWGLPLAVLILGMFMAVLDITIVNIAITNIRKDFGATIEDAQWISTAYGLTEGAVVPISAWVGNRVGHKRLYVWSMALFTFFSLLCGFSTSLNEMIAFRILQAIPGGMIPVTCIVLVYRMVPPAKIGAAMGLYGLGVSLAPGVGPALGGYFVEYASWPYIYWVNVPIGVLAVAAALYVLPTDRGKRGAPLDKAGFFSIVVGLFALLLALEKGSTWGWGSYSVLGLFALGTNLIIVWVVIELQVEHPLLNLRALGNVAFVKSLLLIGVLFCGMFAMLFNMPQFLQQVQGKTPWQTGLVTLPYAFVIMVLMPIAGRIYDAIGSRWPAAIGMFLTGVGLLMLAQMQTDTTVRNLIIAQCVVGLGIGLSMMPIMTGGLAALPPSMGDDGGALNTLFQRISQAFSIAVITALINANHAQFYADRAALMPSRGANGDPAISQMTQDGPRGLLGVWQQLNNEAQTLSFANGFLIAGVLVLAGFLLALTLPTGRPVAPDGQMPAAH